MGTPTFTDLNVSVPDFFKDLNTVLEEHQRRRSENLSALAFAPLRSPVIGQAVPGRKFPLLRPDPHRRHGIGASLEALRGATDDDLGFALGQKYVEQNFPPAAKARVLGMVQEIETMLGQDIQSLDWMTPATKQQALVKLHAVTNKIGYPDKWRDYSSVKIVRGEAVGNDERATEFEVQRDMNKIGKPVDRSEWNMTPPTVNAYYSPLQNNINFPAGILQPPFFDNRMDAAVNYGAIGVGDGA